jgi:hypothetical protein
MVMNVQQNFHFLVHECTMEHIHYCLVSFKVHT